jgi:hypothetical protein
VEAKKYKIIITGINNSTLEVHIVNLVSSEYIDKFFIFGDIDKIMGRIKTICDIYNCKDFILDEKSLSVNLLERLREDGLIGPVC